MTNTEFENWQTLKHRESGYSKNRIMWSFYFDVYHIYLQLVLLVLLFRPTHQFRFRFIS
jgi:hypothetical protein